MHRPDPVTGVLKPTHERFREVLDNALLAEEPGFDGFGVGERHERPFISSSLTVVLSHIAALTRRIRLFTAVTTLSLLDPVRAYGDYATLDHLCEGRLDLFQATPEDQGDRNAESYEVFRQIWRQAVDLAARYGDPLFSANVTNSIEPYAELIRYCITRAAAPQQATRKTARIPVATALRALAVAAYVSPAARSLRPAPRNATADTAHSPAVIGNSHRIDRKKSARPPTVLPSVASMIGS
ncbi:LLM class flavin-dependent oxidoreductase [Streptomyces sp. S.PB5]|uniref:LLM class flavin-dependent oxidoreductase n=1 Tax=Streptomyces sp. S.PB5 TaxID=3020844 RepID=UPI0025B05F81|nr:LLM class flavin-dependent oxidoreductase [Streptomyces sp. S.PB5]MDN3025585.1 LLM class flavin-dependent oxidoreductase [Streptomyces sp. S.PB5]